MKQRVKIITGKHSGFCSGVKSAVDAALAAAQASGGRVVTLGELIHHPAVIRTLEGHGVQKIDSLSELEGLTPEQAAGTTVIIRSHGVPPDAYAALERLGCKTVDATCPYVRSIHRRVAEYAADGFHIVIIGDAAHPEVQGILGCCRDMGTVFSGEDGNLDVSRYEKCCIVAQTTYSASKFARIIKNLVKDDGKIVEIFNTICYTTVRRQEEAESLAAFADAVVVIGGKGSSNTRKLYEICAARAEKVFWIEDAEALVPSFYRELYLPGRDIKYIAIVAGASTPSALIEEVRLNMDKEINAGLEEAVTESVSDTAAAPADAAVQSEQVEAPAEQAVQPEQAAEAPAEQAEAPVEQVAAVEEKVAAPAAPAPEEVKEPLSVMEQALMDMDAKENKFHKGQAVKATIVMVTDDEIVLAIGSKKSDVLLPKDEIEADGSFDKSKYTPGDTMDVLITGLSPMTVSRRAFLLGAKEDALVDGLKEGNSELKVVIDGYNKGGLTAKMGTFTVFIPASHIRLGFVKSEEFEKYKGKEMRLRMIERKGKTIIASARELLAEEREKREAAREIAIAAFFESVEVGQIVEGKVVRFTDFGAFVNVNGFDCLAHISDLAWTNVKRAEDVLQRDQVYEFVVLKLDTEKKHISIGYKQLQPKPWDQAAEKYPAGSVVKGTVVRIAPFGAFVEVESGIDGLVHVSQITHEWIENPASILKIGQEIEAKVLEVKPEAQKLTLSIKALQEAPEVIEGAPADVSGEGRKGGKGRGDRKGKTARSSSEGDLREWSSDDNPNASIGELFKGLKLDVEEEEKEEKVEKKTKKAVKKEKVEEETAVEAAVETEDDNEEK